MNDDSWLPEALWTHYFWRNGLVFWETDWVWTDHFFGKWTDITYTKVTSFISSFCSSDLSRCSSGANAAVLDTADSGAKCRSWMTVADAAACIKDFRASLNAAPFCSFPEAVEKQQLLSKKMTAGIQLTRGPRCCILMRRKSSCGEEALEEDFGESGELFRETTMFKNCGAKICPVGLAKWY